MEMDRGSGRNWQYLSRLGLALVIAMLAVPAGALAARDANNESCGGSPGTEASPGFREYLPDCRAYELVTPPYKEGYPATPFARSAEGSRMIVRSLGAFDGAESVTELGGFYEITRVPEVGWQTVPISPPANEFSYSELDAPSVDLRRTLWDLHSKEQSVLERYFYIREPGGAFVLVGPQIPPAASKGPAGLKAASNLGLFAGASADLSDVLFYIHPPSEAGTPSRLWPGDTTVAGADQSLYEYEGTGKSEPKLVGVSNEGPLARDEEAHLISQCGTGLGQEPNIFGSKYNAVSSSGETVFFTAIGEDDTNCGGVEPPVDEIFARIDGSKTVAISEPSSENCEVCETSSGLEDARFEGASEDGSEAFFTTNQALLPGNTGRNLYEYDFDAPTGPGHPTGRIVLVSGGDATVSSPEADVQGVVRISEDGSHVYFVAKGVLTTNANGEGAEAQPGEDNLYLYERDAQYSEGRIAFVGIVRPSEQICEENEEDGLEETCEQDEKIWEKRDLERPVSATPDGNFLVFVSSADLTLGDTSRVGQAFEYDAQTEALTRISTGQDGFDENGNTDSEADVPRLPSALYGQADEPSIADDTRVISENGSYVFFSSADRLAPRAIEGYQNVYEYHAGEVYLISDGQDTSTVTDSPGVQLYGTDESGEDVFFSTADRLVPQDTDDQLDLYDARIGGGFPAPVSPVQCDQECQGSLGVPPALSPAGSATQAGGGNLAPPPLPVPVSKPKARPLKRAQKLAKALKACRHKPKKRRRPCVKQAEKRYGSPAKKSGHDRRRGK